MSADLGGQLKEFLVLVPDFPGALESRRKAQRVHIETATPMINGGQLPYFGVTLSKHGSEDEHPDINGSLMVIKAEDEASVRAYLDKDAYTRDKVWDVKNAKVIPFIGG